MHILGHLCLLISICSVLDFYKRISEFYLGFFFMDCESFLKFLSLNSDFGCGFLVIGCFRMLVNCLGLFMLSCLVLKALQFSCHCRFFTQFLHGFRGALSELRNGFCLRNGFDGNCDSKVSYCKCGLLGLVKYSNPLVIEKLEGIEDTVDTCCEVKENTNVDEAYYDEDKQEYYGEDKVFDLMTLRKLVKMEWRRANDAYLELEKERMAATTAAEEAMAMILRLQNEKSLIEMEALQYRRLTEEKQLHDQGVIQSLRWIVLKHEAERGLLEDRLRLCRQRLKLYLNCDGEDQSEGISESLSYLNALDDGLISSLDMDLSP